MGKKLSFFLAITLLASLLGACGPASSISEEANAAGQTEAEGSETVAAEESSPDKSNEEKIELNIWDLRTEGAGAKMIDEIIAEFMKENPNITVKRTAFKVADLRNTIKPAINSGEGPDIFSYDAGAGYLGVLANAGLALDLTSHAEELGWNERFHDWALDKTIYNGKLFGIANELEMLGVFYNKKMFEEAGVKPPASYDEFIQICEVFKNKGTTAVIMDDKEQWPGFHYESIWLNSFAGADKVKQAVNGQLPWTTEEFAVALDELYKVFESGYATAKPLSVTYDDANNAFTAGEGAMRITGTWQVAAYVEKMGDNVGFFYLPPASDEVDDCPPGGLGEAVVVNAKTRHEEAAVKFVDYLFNDANMELWYEAGLIPSVKDVDYSTYEVDTLFKDVVDEVNNSENLGENIDVLMPPKVNDATQNYIQELIAGKADGAACMEKKQKAFDEEIAAGNYSVE